MKFSQSQLDAWKDLMKMSWKNKTHFIHVSNLSNPLWKVLMIQISQQKLVRPSISPWSITYEFRLDLVETFWCIYSNDWEEDKSIRSKYLLEKYCRLFSRILMITERKSEKQTESIFYWNSSLTSRKKIPRNISWKQFPMVHGPLVCSSRDPDMSEFREIWEILLSLEISWALLDTI